MSTRGYFAAGGALLLAAVVVAIVLVTTLGAGGRARTASRSVASPPHTYSFSDPPLGLSGSAAADWVFVRGRRFEQLRSGDATAVIFIYSPGQTLTASQLVETALASIRAKYTGVSIARGAESSLGGLPAKTRVVSALNAHRVPVRILVVGARGARLNYILEGVTAERGPAQDLAEMQAIVQGLRLTG